MVYLDHAATTPLRGEAIEAMQRSYGLIGNPSSVHAQGRAARMRLEQAREQLAAALGADPVEVVFTGGGTTADNLAIKGLFWQRQQADPERRVVVVSPLEHSAVLESARWLERTQGAQVVEVPVAAQGLVTPEALEQVLDAYPDQVALVSIGWVNNEIGSIAPIAQLAQIARERGVLMHTDAVQAVGHVPVAFADSGVDALSVAAHKLGGPKGAGALLLRRGVEPVPLLHGGGQERKVHSGTLDVVGAAGFAAAAQVAVREQPGEALRLVQLRDALVAGVLAQVDGAALIGPPLARPDQRSPHVALLRFAGCAGDLLLMGLDEHGICASTGSACSAGVIRPSHVLQALGFSAADSLSGLRFSFGHTSSSADVEAVLAVLAGAVEAARRAGLPTVEPEPNNTAG